MTPSQWTDTNLAYFAGILDGEGCFCLHRTLQGGRSHIHVCAINVGNTDLRLLQWIAARFGGHIFPERRQSATRKDMWRWYASADGMDLWLPVVLPFLIIKRDRAELLIAYRATLPARIRIARSTNDTTENVKQQRATIHAKLAVLNKRGIAS